MKTIAIFLIKLYQLCISPLIGNECRFTPTCSHYGLEAFKKHGFIRAFGLTVKRIARCNPWCDGGSDPVP